MTMNESDFARGEVTANGLKFRYLEMGSGPLALCLHGFPDSAWSYRYLLPELAAQGYRAVAVFMRGYSPTEVPADGDFSTATLGADVTALHDALGGRGDAILIAHDWGAIAAYGSATHAPGHWRRCVIMNVPPFKVFGQIGGRYEQIKSSFYFWFFQMHIAGDVVAADDLAFIDGLWSDWSPGYDAAVDLEYVKECLRDPKNLSAAMGYYHTLFNPATYGSEAFAAEQLGAWGNALSQPTLYMHGTSDGCLLLDEETQQGVLELLGPGSESLRIEDAGHFMMVQQPKEVNRQLLRFVGPPGSPR
jgi:pimeloyl-ACP methyl ester carboxylesterase